MSDTPNASDALVTKAAERIGLLTVQADWNDIRIAELQQALMTVTLERDQLNTEYHVLRVERDRLAADLIAALPPAKPGRTPMTPRVPKVK